MNVAVSSRVDNSSSLPNVVGERTRSVSASPASTGSSAPCPRLNVNQRARVVLASDGVGHAGLIRARAALRRRFSMDMSPSYISSTRVHIKDAHSLTAGRPRAAKSPRMQDVAKQNPTTAMLRSGEASWPWGERTNADSLKRGVLYRVLAAELETFLATVEADPSRYLPGFVKRELRGFLDFGILSRGFARVSCEANGRGRDTHLSAQPTEWQMDPGECGATKLEGRLFQESPSKDMDVRDPRPATSPDTSEKSGAVRHFCCEQRT